MTIANNQQDLKNAQSTFNATVPLDALIQPAQAFVDIAQDYLLGNIVSTATAFNFSNRGITSVSAEGLLGTSFLSNAGSPDLNLAVNALTVTTVNAILAWYAQDAAHLVGGGDLVLNLSGGTNAAPTKEAIGDATIVGGGTGYLDGDALVFTGGGGTGAAATVTTTLGVITGITFTNHGSGYTSNPAITVTSVGGTGANLTAVRRNADQITLEDAGWTVSTN